MGCAINATKRHVLSWGMAHLHSALDRAARSLADDLQNFLIKRHETRPEDDSPTDAAFVEHEKATVRLYDERFAGKVHKIAAAFRAKGAETRDVLFRHVEDGVTGESDVNAILVGLVRVSNALHVAEFSATR